MDGSSLPIPCLFLLSAIKTLEKQRNTKKSVDFMREAPGPPAESDDMRGNQQRTLTEPLKKAIK